MKLEPTVEPAEEGGTQAVGFSLNSISLPGCASTGSSSLSPSRVMYTDGIGATVIEKVARPRPSALPEYMTRIYTEGPMRCTRLNRIEKLLTTSWKKRSEPSASVFWWTDFEAITRFRMI